MICVARMRTLIILSVVFKSRYAVTATATLTRNLLVPNQNFISSDQHLPISLSLLYSQTRACCPPHYSPLRECVYVLGAYLGTQALRQATRGGIEVVIVAKDCLLLAISAFFNSWLFCGQNLLAFWQFNSCLNF